VFLANRIITKELVVMPTQPYRLVESCSDPVDKHFGSTLYLERSVPTNKNRFPMSGNPDLIAKSVYAVFASNQKQLSAHSLMIMGTAILMMDDYYNSGTPPTTPGSSLAATAHAFQILKDWTPS
jgi:hypothetical protein